MIRSVEKAITDHHPIKPDASVICAACPNTPWTLQHFYDQIIDACRDERLDHLTGND